MEVSFSTLALKQSYFKQRVEAKERKWTQENKGSKGNCDHTFSNEKQLTLYFQTRTIHLSRYLCHTIYGDGWGF